MISDDDDDDDDDDDEDDDDDVRVGFFESVLHHDFSVVVTIYE